MMLRRSILVFLVGALVSMAGARVRAQEHSAKDEKGHTTAGPAEGHGSSGHQGEGKPSVFQGVLDLTIWTIVVFLLLVLILGKYAWKPMLEGLQKREDAIHSALAESQKARDEAQRLRDELRAEMSKANDKVREILEEARRDAQTMSDEMIAKARSEIQGERDRLRREIETARDQALQELWQQTATLAAEISAKVIRKQMTPDDHRRLIDDALTELQSQNVGWKERSLVL